MPSNFPQSISFVLTIVHPFVRLARVFAAFLQQKNSCASKLYIRPTDGPLDSSAGHLHVLNPRERWPFHLAALPQRTVPPPCLASLQRFQYCQPWLQAGRMGGGGEMMENMWGGMVENGRRTCMGEERMCVDSNIWEPRFIKVICVHFVSGTKWETTRLSVDSEEEARQNRTKASAAFLQEVPTTMRERFGLLSRPKGLALHPLAPTPHPTFLEQNWLLWVDHRRSILEDSLRTLVILVRMLYCVDPIVWSPDFQVVHAPFLWSSYGNCCCVMQWWSVTSVQNPLTQQAVTDKDLCILSNHCFSHYIAC